MSRMTTPTMSHPQTQGKIPHEKIAMRAYEKWCQRGRPSGTHMQDWLDAERELMSEQTRSNNAFGRR